MASHLNLLESLNVCYLELVLSIQRKEKICNHDKFMEEDYIEPQKLMSELLNKSSIVTKSIFEISSGFIINLNCVGRYLQSNDKQCEIQKAYFPKSLPNVMKVLIIYHLK